MAISRLLGSFVLITGALAAAAGCESAAAPDQQVSIGAEDTGTITLDLAKAPSDAACLRLTVKGATVAVRSFTLTTPTLPLTASGLPLGDVVVTGEAFGTACSQITTESVATYVSDATSATLLDGQTASIALVLHKAGSANISVDFPNAGQCDGSPGQWDGCRGTGCWVCSEKLAEFPRYIQNHPNCVKNDTCAGQFFTCNAACPAPTDADRDVQACMGTPGNWSGCRGTGCFVCSEKTKDYPLYFQNHPACVKNDTCAGEFFTCNANCPAPTDADKGALKQYIEAESGTLQAPLVAVSDAAASGAKYIWSGTSSTTGNTPPTTGHASYSFSVPALPNVSTQTLKVFGRFNVGPGAGSDDSLFVRIDGGAWTVWNDIASRMTPGSYAWDSAHDFNAANAEKSWPIAAGSHTLEIAYREDGLKMDQFFVTTDSAAKP
ncbi:MAG TPA: hypothetical protein VHB79_32930 [Polyangiaceae bacterium]|nr:hypothetical protein [Polyangiaceae bacterium]